MQEINSLPKYDLDTKKLYGSREALNKYLKMALMRISQGVQLISLRTPHEVKIT